MPWPRSSSRIHSADVVEEVAIVRDRDDGAGYASRYFSSHAIGLGVEVVGGLVEQQHLGRLEQQPAQRHAAFLATRELVDMASHGGRRRASAAISSLRSRVPSRRRQSMASCSSACSSSSLFISSSSIGSANFVRDLVEARDLREGSARPSSTTTLRTSFVGIELRFLRQVADLDAGLRRALRLRSWCLCRP